MELEQIQIFAAVAKHFSFSAAAAELFISHSTTSRTVSALEQELGVRLLERSGNRIFGLTEADAFCCTTEAFSLPNAMR